jgi:hypothetical protein
MTRYCWNVSRPKNPKGRDPSFTDEFVAQGRQSSLRMAKVVAERNHQRGCETTVWRFATTEVYELIKGKWRKR